MVQRFACTWYLDTRDRSCEVGSTWLGIDRNLLAMIWYLWAKPSFFVWFVVLQVAIKFFYCIVVACRNIIMRRGTQQWHDFRAPATRSCTASNRSCICMTMWCRFTAFFEPWCCCNVQLWCVRCFNFCCVLLAGTYKERNGWPYAIFSSSWAIPESFEFFGCILIVTLHYVLYVTVCAL